MVPDAGLAGRAKAPLVIAIVRTIQSICWPPIVIAFEYRVTSPTADPFEPTLWDLLAAKKLTVLKLALYVCADSSNIEINRIQIPVTTLQFKNSSRQIQVTQDIIKL